MLQFRFFLCYRCNLEGGQLLQDTSAAIHVRSIINIALIPNLLEVFYVIASGGLYFLIHITQFTVLKNSRPCQDLNL